MSYLGEDKCFSAYANSVGEYPLLSRKEERELFKVYWKWRNNTKAGQGTRKNGRLAREKLINSNLRLVIKMARDYSYCGLPLLDLINEGNIGLMKAVERFEPKKGTKLSTYACLWIRQKILRAINNKAHIIRIPVDANAKYLKIIKYINQQKEEHGIEPSREEIMAKFKITKKRLDNVFEVRGGMVSINKAVNDSSKYSAGGLDATVEDIIEDTRTIASSELAELSDNKKVLMSLLNKLSKREKYILCNRFGVGDDETQTLEKIGSRYKISRERIRQIETAALRKLRALVSRKYKIHEENKFMLTF